MVFWVLTMECDLLTLYSKYHGGWWSGEMRNHIISIYDITEVIQKYSGSTRMVNAQLYFNGGSCGRNLGVIPLQLHWCGHLNDPIRTYHSYTNVNWQEANIGCKMATLLNMRTKYIVNPKNIYMLHTYILHQTHDKVHNILQSSHTILYTQTRQGNFSSQFQCENINFYCKLHAEKYLQCC